MGISELQQALHSVAIKGSLDSFRYNILDNSPALVRTVADATRVPTKENGLQLTLF